MTAPSLQQRFTALCGLLDEIDECIHRVRAAATQLSFAAMGEASTEIGVKLTQATILNDALKASIAKNVARERMEASDAR